MKTKKRKRFVELTRRGTLAERIAAGIADPISAREREQLAELREIYKRRFGEYPD